MKRPTVDYQICDFALALTTEAFLGVWADAQANGQTTTFAFHNCL
jgi:hypothetical protein